MRFVTIGCRARYDCAGPPLARNHCIRAGAIIRYCGKQTLNDRVGWARQSTGRQADAAMEMSYAAIGRRPTGRSPCVECCGLAKQRPFHESGHRIRRRSHCGGQRIADLEQPVHRTRAGRRVERASVKRGYSGTDCLDGGVTILGAAPLQHGSAPGTAFKPPPASVRP
jgi:hypothetical protein